MKKLNKIDWKGCELLVTKKNTINIKFLILVVYVFFVSCQRTQNPEETYSNYRIIAKLDTTDLSLDCQMQVDWYNSSDSLINKIPFTFELDSTKTLVNKIMIDEKVQDFKYAVIETDGFEGFILTLSEPVKQTEKISISINFKTKPNDYMWERALFFGHRYWGYDIEGFPLVQYFSNGKFNPNYQVHSNYNVKITYPKEFNIAPTGKIENIDTINDEIVVNTSAKLVPAYGFILLKDVILKEDSISGVTIRSLYSEDDSKWGEKLLEYSKDIIEFYVDTLGFYPQPVLTIFPGGPNPNGGWANCPNVVGIHRGIDQYEEKADMFGHWIMSHEVAHQYWGFNYVLEPTNYPQWFGIGMGIYTDKLYASQNIPDFNYSKNFSRSYLHAIKEGYNTTIMQTVDTLNKQGFDWNNSIMHNKSFSVLQMLAYEIGEKTFFEIYKYCLDNYQGINVTLEMFKKDCERISNRNLDEFFQTWFFTNDYLEYQIDTVVTTYNNNQYQNEIKINKIGQANISHVELEVVLEENKKERIKFDGRKKTESLKISTEKAISKIIIDPDLKLLLVNRTEWNKNN